MQTIQAEGKLFVHCVTSWNSPVPSGCMIGETELDGFFFQLIDSGYNGFAYLIGSTLIGIEWSDIFPMQKSSKETKRKK